VLPAGHANPAAAAAYAAAAVPTLDSYQRLHHTQPSVVVAAPSAGDVEQSLTQNKDLLLPSNSPAVNEALFTVSPWGHTKRRRADGPDDGSLVPTSRLARRS